MQGGSKLPKNPFGLFRQCFAVCCAQTPSPDGDGVYTCSLRCIFCQAHVLTEYDLNFIRCCCSELCEADFIRKIKTPPENRWCNYSNGKSDSSLDLIGTEASGTCVNMAGSSIHDSLDTLNIGLPCTVSPSVGVGDLDTKGYALTTKIALSHFIAPPIRMIYSTNYANIRRLDMIPDNP